MELDLEIVDYEIKAIYQRRLENYFDFLQKQDFIQETLNKVAVFWKDKVERHLESIPGTCKTPFMRFRVQNIDFLRQNEHLCRSTFD